MPFPTRAKDSWVDIYECKSETFIATASQTAFVVSQTPLNDTVADANNVAYHRVYANGVKIPITSVTGSTKTFVVAAQQAGTIVEIIYPKTANQGIRIQQSVDYSSDAKTDEWEELGNVASYKDLISRSGSGSFKLLKNDKAALALLEGYAESGTICLVCIKDAKATLTKAERINMLEVTFNGVKGGIAVGGRWEDTYSFNFRTPIEPMAIT